MFIETVFTKIAETNDFEIEALEIAEDHVYIFLGFTPRYSISQVVQRVKGGSARSIFQVFPDVKNELWGGKFWEDCYFVRTLGNKVTKDLIKKYIEYHNHNEKWPQHLELSRKPSLLKRG